MSAYTKTAIAGFMAAVAVVMLAASCAHAETVRLTCTPPTQNTDGSVITGAITYRFYGGPSPVDSTTCAANINVIDPLPGQSITYPFQATAIVGGAESAKSATVSKTITTPLPPTTKTLKVIEPAVYNTGSFSPTLWLVRKNKLYGTIPLGTLCDATKPAADGYYRVPGTAVRWTNSLAKTPYPLAKCALQ